ncbi:MAG: nucleoid-associated protein [Candidatus Delongbacteria bacterium]|nr:nucleoid-associated protein [Candidatus Delongbacteria bacterium]
MIDYTNTDIEKVSVHTVGNKTNGEELLLSKSLLDISDLKVRELLFKFFLIPFANPEFYSFTFSNEDFTLNPLFNFASQIFDSSKTFQKNSVNVAKHLYELSVHPQIKSGDLFLSYFTDISIKGELTDAIGIFKSENRQAFLKLNSSQEDFSIQCDNGINIEKLDKGCLIFNTDKKAGYKVCIIDRSNKSVEAQYWKDNFLQLKPCSDDFHHTKEFMNITKNFVTKQLTEEFEVSRADQIDLLNRSVGYFKTHDSFDKEDFEKQVFHDTDIISSFQNFDKQYRKNNNIELNDNFEVSPQAVKKLSKVFKSVLKLDRNFHIYIHGNRQLIEKGVDENGRKYYKIYYEEES